MKPLPPEELCYFSLAKEWASSKNYQATFIVLEALLKKRPSHSNYLFAFIEILEILDPIKAYTSLSDLLAGEAKWSEVFCHLKQSDRAQLYERHGAIALKLKDEAAALESLKIAASLGRHSLLLWSTLAYLFVMNQEINMSLTSFYQAMKLYREPSLFDECPSGLGLSQYRIVDEDLFFNIALALAPQLPQREAKKLCFLVQECFPGRSWLLDLQEIVSKESLKEPITSTGDSHACTDQKSW